MKGNSRRKASVWYVLVTLVVLLLTGGTYLFLSVYPGSSWNIYEQLKEPFNGTVSVRTWSDGTGYYVITGEKYPHHTIQIDSLPGELAKEGSNVRCTFRSYDVIGGDYSAAASGASCNAR